MKVEMKVGDLVHVRDNLGNSFGHGILLVLHSDVNNIMTYRYSKIWMFKFTKMPLVVEKIMELRTDLIKPIKSAEDWDN